MGPVNEHMHHLVVGVNVGSISDNLTESEILLTFGLM